MKIENHIVNRLLTDENFWTELIITQAQNEGVDLMASNNLDRDTENYRSMWPLLSSEGNKTYYVTNSVLEHMGLFDTKKCMDLEGWKVFKTLPDFKKTFILPTPPNSSDSKCLRVWKKGNIIYICHFEFKFHPKGLQRRGNDGNVAWVLLYVNMDTEICDHFQSEDGKRLAPFIYALMCFVELCDNQVVEVAPQAKYGTQKTGKIINTLPFPITVINNTWNVKTIRTEGFPVSGHVHLYWTGPGRTIPSLIYVEPYSKSGYTRRSGKELSQ